jgi:glucose/arabinose dehydrogenase
MRVRSRFALLLAAVAALSCDEPNRNAGPSAEFTQPLAGMLFAAGDTIDVELEGVDVSGGDPLPSYSWWVTLHHNTHVHPYHPVTSARTGSFAVSRGGHDDHNIFLRVYGRELHADGRADTSFVDLYPQLTTLELTSAPSGALLTVDGVPHQTPFKDTVIVGADIVIDAPEEQVLGSVVYAFGGWATTDSATRTIRMPQTAVVLGASYDSIASTNAAPSVAVTGPSAGTPLNAGSVATLEAAAADADGSVALVEFLVDGSVVGSDASAPYAFAWNVVGSGARSISARATDNAGATVTSNAVNVSVQPTGAPITTLTSPTDATLDLSGTVAMTADVTDDGPVTFVEFAVDGEVIAADSAAPFAAVIGATADYASGVHVIRARAQDADGNYSAWSSARVTFGGSVALGAGFTRTTVATGLGATPTAIAVAPDGRLFVTEQTGALRVIKDGALLAQPFVTLAVDAIGEHGLVGVVLDPDFATNGWVYVYYTTTENGAHNRVSRFTAAGDVALPGSETAILDLPPLGPAARHAGGAMRFGVDGFLYIAVGDDGVAMNAPALTTPFGKVLRIGKDGAVPPSNPFYGVASGVNRAIWSKGLRNPFTFDIDAVTGRIHINDVGQSTWEEVNLGRAGADYGWPGSEGQTTNPAYDTPLLTYRHQEPSPTLFSGFAAVGAAFYRPSVNAFGVGYVGDYFFADYVRSWIYRLDAEADWAAYAFAQLDDAITGLAVGNDGALYVLVATRVDRISR